MRLFFISLILSFLTLSAIAVDRSEYDIYLSKIFETKFHPKKDFTTIEVSSTLKNWLVEVDEILDTNKISAYNADFKFNLDELGNIVAVELVNLEENDFDKFKNFVEYLSSIRFPAASIDLSRFNFYLEGATLYLDRPKQVSIKLEATKTKDLDSKLASLTQDEFYLVKPKYLDYSFLGQEILMKNGKGVFLKSYVTTKKDSKIFLNVFKAYDEDELVHMNLDFIITIEKDKNLAFKLVRSGLANGLKAGLVNSYNTYGIAPGALALMGMAGTAIIDHETENSFSLEKGEILQIKKVEENK